MKKKNFRKFSNKFLPGQAAGIVGALAKTSLERRSQDSNCATRAIISPLPRHFFSHFSRGSTPTRSSKDDNLYLDLSGNSSQAYHDDYHYYDEESI